MPPRNRASLSELGGDIFEPPEPDANHPVDTITSNEGRFVQIPLDRIRPNPEQPRQRFGENELAELADSIKANGLIQPIVVEESGDGFFTLLVGERRWRAAQLASFPKIQAFVRPSGADRLLLAIIENAQRQDLNPIEDAEALAKLSGRGHTNQHIARLLSKSEPTVSEILGLNRLPEDIKAQVRSGEVAVPRSTLALIAAADTEAAMRSLWDQARAGLTVREVRRLARSTPTHGRPKHHAFRYRDPKKLYEVQVRFRKPHATADEVRAALRAALKET